MAIHSDGPAPINVRRVAFAVSALACIIDIFLVAAPYWRVTAMWGTAAVIANIYSFEGIFLSCVRTMGNVGTNQCYQMPSFGGVPTAGGYPNMAMYGRGVYGKLENNEKRFVRSFENRMRIESLLPSKTISFKDLLL